MTTKKEILSKIECTSLRRNQFLRISPRYNGEITFEVIENPIIQKKVVLIERKKSFLDPGDPLEKVETMKVDFYAGSFEMSRFCRREFKAHTLEEIFLKYSDELDRAFYLLHIQESLVKGVESL